MSRGDSGERVRLAAWPWIALILLLLAVRLPSLVQPAGGDQGLYGYAGQRLLAGDVMYRDVWDQKPPAIAFIYALLWRAWPSERIVPGSDLLVAGAVAWLLVILGRRRYTASVGYGAAAIYLLLGDPYLQRQSGLYVRAQCEPFIALAITAALVVLAGRRHTRWHLVGAGALFAIAFWLKYNAAAYGVAIAAAAWCWSPGDRQPSRLLRSGAWIAAGAALLSMGVLTYFVANGALLDLRLATIDYNLRYSNETYEGTAAPFWYVLTFPLDRARLDPLWFAGGLGVLLLASGRPRDRSTVVIFGWMLAAMLSIAINGSRGLPNYFVQANPALGLAAAAGLSGLAGRGVAVRTTTAILLLVGLWRVGSDAPVAGFRLASIPGLVANANFDLRYARGAIDRETYLGRFAGEKHDPLEIERLVQDVRRSTASGERIFVFGFSGGSVSWLSERASSSRFFWSRPITIDFAADRPGYGWSGLLEDLREHPPAMVVLQREEWRSEAHLLGNDALRGWLEEGYALERDTPEFSIWRPRRERVENDRRAPGH